MGRDRQRLDFWPLGHRWQRKAHAAPDLNFRILFFSSFLVNSLCGHYGTHLKVTISSMWASTRKPSMCPLPRCFHFARVRPHSGVENRQWHSVHTSPPPRARRAAPVQAPLPMAVSIIVAHLANQTRRLVCTVLRRDVRANEWMGAYAAHLRHLTPALLVVGRHLPPYGVRYEAVSLQDRRKRQ